MGLRDTNPLIDQDLDIIIKAFEKGMIKSRDSDSVFVPFRRELSSMEALPTSIVTSIESVAAPSGNTLVGSNDATQSASGDFPQGSSGSIPSAEQSTDNPTEEQDDTEDDSDLQEKVEKWVEDCIPCNFRTMSNLDADFFADIGDGWKDALDKTFDNLKKLDKLLDESVNLEKPLCELGEIFKAQCVPDIKKMIFVMSMFLDSLELQVGADLGIFDSFLTSLLTPLFNELCANLDIIDEISLGPLRCVLDQIRYNINRGPEMAKQMQQSINSQASQVADQTRRQVRQAEDQARRTNEEIQNQARQQARDTRVSEEEPSQAQQIAERTGAERQAESRQSQSETPDALDRVNDILDETDDALSMLDKFKDYLKTATDFLEQKKKWLLDLLQSFIDDGCDRWNKKVSFAEGKKDILDFISMMKAVVDAAKNGDFRCGNESGTMTEEEFKILIGTYRHPSESLNISLEGDSIVVRRLTDVVGKSSSGSQGPTGSREAGVTNQVDTGETDLLSQRAGNIVMRRPISSCLKKVTQDQVDQVSYWIDQFSNSGD
jgi:hypothetical protein